MSNILNWRQLHNIHKHILASVSWLGAGVVVSLLTLVLTESQSVLTIILLLGAAAFYLLSLIVCIACCPEEIKKYDCYNDYFDASIARKENENTDNEKSDLARYMALAESRLQSSDDNLDTNALAKVIMEVKKELFPVTLSKEIRQEWEEHEKNPSLHRLVSAYGFIISLSLFAALAGIALAGIFGNF